MSLTQYEPWNLLDQLQNELSRSFQNRYLRNRDENSKVVTSDWVPAVDVKEENDAFLILADLPGVDPKDIEIHMEDGVISIKGQRVSHKEEESEGYKRVERASGNFYRKFSLPDTADAEQISAKGNNGVLEICIPKLRKAQPRRIEIQQ